MDPVPSGNVETQLAELRSRVHCLEAALNRYGVPLEIESAPAPEPLQAPLAEPAAKPAWTPPHAPIPAQAPVREFVPAAPLFAASAAPESRLATPSLESRIGSQWFNRLGILAVLIGMAWFLKLAIDNHWIGPLGRVLTGLIAGAGLIAWSERFRSRGYAAFSYSLKALGSGILYLSLWAAFSFFHLVPAGVAFAAMIAITAFNGYLAWMQDAELLAVYAIAGGLSTPLLVSTGANHEVTLFSYLLLLDAAVLILVALRPWSRLLFMAYVGTAVFFLGWWIEFYSSGQAGRTAFFILCFFLMFALAPRLVRVNLDAETRVSGWDTLALVLMPIANAACSFLLLYAVLDSTDANWAEPWLAVGFAAFYLALLRLPALGLLLPARGVLGDLHLTAVVVFLTIAIPLKANGRWLTTGWLVEGAALFWVAAHLRSTLVRVLAALCLVLGLGALLLINPPVSSTPVFNQRFATYCVAIAVFAFIGWLAKRQIETSPESFGGWAAIAAGSVLAINALVLIAVCLEIHSYWWHLRWNGNWQLAHDHRMYAQFTYSAFLMLMGIALLAIGFWQRSAFLRWQALALLAVAIGKVFIVDVSELSQGYRIVSFLGLGALLLAVSFVYQRDWLNLRGDLRREAEAPSGTNGRPA